MLPDAALMLGLAADTNVLAFCQPPREPGLMCLPMHLHVGNASVHQLPVRLGFILFSPTLLKAERFWH